MILNRHEYPCLYDDGSVEYGNSPKVLRFPNTFVDKDYWYLEILYTYKNCNNPPIKIIENYIPNDILNKIKNENVFLLVLGIEPILDIVEDVYRCIQKCNIPENKVVIVTELIDIKCEIDRVSSLYNLNKVKTLYISIDEHAMSFQLRKYFDHFSKSIPLSNKHFKKSFINLNRRWRIHRPLFVSLLKCKNLLDKGYVSLGDTKESTLNWNNVFESLIEMVDTDTDTKKLLLANKDELVNLSNMFVDTEQLDVNLANLYHFESTKKYYEETYFSIVSETCFFDNVGRFVTEKIFKPMAHRHPFIAIAPYKTLEFLRERNYKTFHPFIDETYDTIEDNMTRMEYVLAETERLCNLSETELETFIKNVKPIVDYNFSIIQFRLKDTFITEIG